MSRKPTPSGIIRKCAFCNRDFEPAARSVRMGLGLYCSRACSTTFKNLQPKVHLTLEERFWKHVNKNGALPVDESLGPCWLWTGSTIGKGKWAHGKLGGTSSSDGKTIAAHRLSYELHVGPIPDGMLICHKCDIAICVNWQHLFVGTSADNTHDMCDKNRHPGIRFTTEKVREIRQRHAAGESAETLAIAYGTALQNMRNMLRGKTWANI